MSVTADDVLAHSGFVRMNEDDKKSNGDSLAITTICERLHKDGPVQTLRAMGMLRETKGTLHYLQKWKLHHYSHKRPSHVFLVRERFCVSRVLEPSKTDITLLPSDVNFGLISAVHCDGMTELRADLVCFGPTIIHTDDGGNINDLTVAIQNEADIERWNCFPDFGFQTHELLMGSLCQSMTIIVEPEPRTRTINIQIDGLRFLKFNGFFSTGWMFTRS